MNVRRTRLSRPLSLLLASTMTALLVFSGGVATADEVAPDPTPAETVTEAPTPTEEPTPIEEPAPPVEDTEDPAPETETPTVPTEPAAPSEDVEDADAPSDGTDGLTGPNLISKALALPALAALVVPCVGGPGVPVGGFEIDGNTCSQAPVNKDWGNTGASVEDGFDDATGFTGGSSENDPPTSWTVGGSPNGKTDIGTAWAYSQVSGGQVYGFFGLTNNSTSGGTSQYDLEYNQLNPVTNGGGFDVPNRSPGDLLFRFSSTGSAAIDFTDAKKYTLVSSPAWNGSCFSTTANNSAGWCTIPIPPAAFAQQVNADGTFFEGAINISLFFGNGTCSGTFGTTFIRSVTGNAFATSALKDYVIPLGVNTPSTCGKIVINKQDLAGNPIGGATFSVSPNPDPALPNATAYSITDNDSKDKNPANGVIEISPVDPNESYTVTETSPPSGYLLPAQPSQGPTLVGPSQTITFTFNDPKQFQALTATKTANPTYTAQYAWSITKEVSPNGQDGWVDDAITKNVPAAGNPTLASLFYRVKVTEGARTTSNYKVSGNVSVTNPNASAVTADISDSLPGATCLVAGNATHTVAVPANSTTPYAYVCSFAGVPTQAQLTGTNTASVSWDKSDYPQVQGDINAAGSYSISPTAGYAFGAETTSIDKTVTVTDSHHVFNPALTYSWSNEGDVNTSDVYTIGFSAVPGSCSVTLVNTATLTGATTGVLDTDTASGTICAAQDLSITRLDVRGFKRTYPWAIQKKTTTPKVVVDGGTATADYEVTVTAGDGSDSDWAMSGTITAHNPNTFESVSVTSVPVTYSGGGTCAVTGEVFPVVIPASGSHPFAYSCSFGGVQPNYTGTVNATVNWNQAAASTPNSSVSDGLGVTEANWTTTLVNATVTVHDDHAAGEDNVIDTLNWADVHALPNHQQVLKYTVNLQDLPDGGTCGTKVNTAWILGDGQTQLDADQNVGNNSATVQVCNPVGLSLSDSAVGDFTRTYNWKIDKFIDTDKKSQQVTIDKYDHTFSYRVIATPLDRVDSLWTVTGSITVENDNTDAAIDPITVTGVAELLGGVNESCDYDKAVPFDLASNENATVNFTCTTATPPANNGAEPPVYQGTHSANVTWGVAGTATTTPAALSWNAPSEVDKSIAVYDNKVNNIFIPVKLGDAAWNAAGTPVVFTYDLNLSVPKDTAGGCAPPFANLAWLGGNGIIPTQQQSAAQAIICVNAAEWTVEKSSVTDPDPLLPGGTITYTLTLKHTAGVPAENVVVEDDLSQVLNHASGLIGVKINGLDAVLQPVADLLTWTVPVLTDTATLEYTVTVDDDAWATTFTNAATPESPGGTCVGENECKTTDSTPTLPKLTLVKEVINGKGGVAEPVDWTVTATPFNIDGQDAVSGNGDPTDGGGVSEVDVLPGVYNLGESGGPDGYSQVGDWDCGDAQQESDQVALAYGDTVTCTVTNQQDSVWKIVKSSVPASGTVEPGDEITYTLTPTWVAGVNPTDLDITDDYSGLVGKTSPVEIVNPDVTFNGDDTFTWHIDTLTDETEPLSYTVTVNEDAIGVTLVNLVTAPGTNCEPSAQPKSLAIVLPVTPDDCTVVHVTPEWTLEKISDPESGSTVDPGQVITYTLTATNVSDALVTGQQVTDDLSDVLDTATLNETPDDVLWSVVGTKLTWNVPDLGPGESAQLVYSVTLDADAINVVVNVATPETPTGHCVTEDGCTTNHVPSPEPPVINPPEPEAPHPAGLPDTGGFDRWMLQLALSLLGAGGAMALMARRRERRS